MSAKKPDAIPFSWLLSTPKNRAALHRSITREKDDLELRKAFTAELIDGAAKGAKFSPGRHDAGPTEETLRIHAHIGDLLAMHSKPKRSARWLFEHAADKNILNGMALKTFEKHVGDVRRKSKTAK